MKYYFNCYNNVVLSWVDEDTWGTLSFVSVIAKVVALLPLEITQFADTVRAFQEFSKNYISLLMAQLFLHL